MPTVRSMVQGSLARPVTYVQATEDRDQDFYGGEKEKRMGGKEGWRDGGENL